MKKIYIGADHNGFNLKEHIKNYLQSKGYEYEDLGNKIHNPDDDYPQYAHAVAEKVAKNKNSTGILLCGSSHGVCFTANKTRGIRGAEISDPEDAITARAHTDCNVMCLSGWKLTDINEVKRTVDIWLKTEFSNEERHHRRIEQVTKIENDIALNS